MQGDPDLYGVFAPHGGITLSQRSGFGDFPCSEALGISRSAGEQKSCKEDICLGPRARSPASRPRRLPLYSSGRCFSDGSCQVMGGIRLRAPNRPASASVAAAITVVASRRIGIRPPRTRRDRSARTWAEAGAFALPGHRRRRRERGATGQVLAHRLAHWETCQPTSERSIPLASRGSTKIFVSWGIQQ
jgi:hypothetical protein